ncbi:glycosyltransferase [Aquabacterium sp. NJ1]|uniref:MraY family glycosyltransferase n=1 Tax=Aquabacterium sp. NJ1 TaxID=1538295 RepID=UPI0013777C69|nr:glycosyltransferase [Aquabacterium sp. NJ1]
MSTILTWRLAAIFAGSFVICALLVLTQRWHGRLSLDHDLAGVQKIHAKPVPRVGGLGLAFGLIIAVLAGYLTGGTTYPTTLVLLACATPVFLTGLAEDLTKTVRVRTRLLASFASAALAIWVLDIRYTDLDTVLLDSLIRHPVVSVLFTVFAVGGVTHSINIVDGLNGLAAGTVSIMLAGLATLAWMHGDMLVMKLCLWGIASMGGFLLFNYPFGRIFLGDGGAYLAGFWLAQCGVMLLERNPRMSAWALMLVWIYPVWETVFSMYRRRVRDGIATGQADLGHMHQLLYRNLRIKNRGQGKPSQEWLRHGLASATIWATVLGCQIIAVLASESTAITCLAVWTYAAGYVWVYRQLNANGENLRQVAHVANA